MNETEVRTRHFSRVEYERLVDGGTLGPDERFELIGGHWVARRPPPHTHGPPQGLAARAPPLRGAEGVVAVGRPRARAPAGAAGPCRGGRARPRARRARRAPPSLLP